MKHLFFVAVASGILSGTTISLQAQTNVNFEKLVSKSGPNTSLKFIEDIELVPGSSPTDYSGSVEMVRSQELAVAAPILTSNEFVNSLESSSRLQFKYALLMDRDVESISNLSLYGKIDDWWGTRYRYGGTDRNGIDCSALTGMLLSDVYGVNVPRTAKEQFNLSEKVATEELAEGDLVFFNTRGGVSHVGLYLGDHYFVHSSTSNGVTISSLNDDYYSRKFISGGRLLRK